MSDQLRYSGGKKSANCLRLVSSLTRFTTVAWKSSRVGDVPPSGFPGRAARPGDRHGVKDRLRERTALIEPFAGVLL